MRRLIINADDLGYDPAVTAGILRAMREGVVTSATLMVNTPFSEEAAAQAGGLSLGLHLNLARWRPVGESIPPGLLRDGELDERRAPELPADAVRAETAAQLRRFEVLTGAAPTHVDVHKHLHRHPNVLEGLCAAASDAGLPVRSIDEGMRAALRQRGLRTPDHFIGDAAREAYWTGERLREQLSSMADGITELMCHPGYAPSHVRSGYGAQREIELATFTAPESRSLLRAAGVELAGFGVLGSP